MGKTHPEPVLSSSPAGNWNDILVGCPHVWKEADGNYYMSFTGKNYKSANWAIGIAKSSDLINCKNFQKILFYQEIKAAGMQGYTEQQSSNIIINITFFYEAVKGVSITQNKLVYMLPAPLRKGLGRIYRIFTSSSISEAVAHAENRAIGLAVSRDLLKWVNFHWNPVLKKVKAINLFLQPLNRNEIRQVFVHRIYF